jgi:hypothetical protein
MGVITYKRNFNSVPAPAISKRSSSASVVTPLVSFGNRYGGSDNAESVGQPPFP